MAFCFLCKDLSFLFYSELIQHFKTDHSLDAKSCVTCSQPSCNRMFTNRNSFKKHFLKSHPEIPLECDLSVDPILLDEFPDDNIIETEQSMPPNGFHIPSTSSTKFLENPNVIINNDDSSCSIMTDEKIQQIVEDSILCFCSLLNSFPAIPSSYIQLVTNNVITLVQVLTNVYQNKLISACSNSSDEGVEHNLTAINNVFSIVENSFDKFRTHYKQMKAFKEGGTYIAPTNIVHGRIFKRRKLKSGIHIVPVKVTSTIIPIRKVLKKFISQKNVLKDIQDYTEELEKEDLVITNFMQGNCWRRVPKRQDGVVLPLFIFNDAFECGNPLGGHAGLNKIEGTYLSLPCLRPENRSTLNKIFPFMLSNSLNLKRFGKKVVFKHVVKELNILAKEGITVESDTFNKVRVFFQLGLLLGDNLSLNGLGGFTENFSKSNYCCRICYCTKMDRESMTSENPALLRKPWMYERDVEKKNPKDSGVKERCVLNDVINFHILRNCSCDIMHDVFEGIAKFDILFLITYFIKKKKFSLAEYNSKLNRFDFGVDNSSRPPALGKSYAKKKTMKISSSECMSLVKYLPLIIGDLTILEDPAWDLFVSLRRIVDIIMRPSVPLDHCDLLTRYVQEHHSLYMNLTGRNLTIKFHNLVHYPRLIREYGPLIHTWSMRYDAKHKVLKSVATSVATRKNLSFTIAKKSQLHLSHEFYNNNFVRSSVVWGPNAFSSSNFWENLDTTLLTTPCPEVLKHKNTAIRPWIEIHGTKYQEGVILNLDIDEVTSLPLFGVFKKVFITEDQKVYFFLQNYQTTEFDTKLFSFKIELVQSYSFLEQEKIHDYHIHTGVRAFGGLYVSPLYW